MSQEIKLNIGTLSLNAVEWVPQGATPTTPTIIFTPGLGESLAYGGIEKMYVHGHARFLKSGYNPNYRIICVQPTSSWISPSTYDKIVDAVRSRYNMGSNKVALTGLSAGASSLYNYIKDPNLNASSKVKAVVPMSFSYVGEDSEYMGMNVWGFCSPSDSSGRFSTMTAWIDRLKKAGHKSAKFTSYNGGHCCWNNFYNPLFKESGQNVYDFLAGFVSPVPVPPPLPPPLVHNIPGTIQAEHYSVMSGVKTENTRDTGGGLNVGWIDKGNWMDYNVLVESSGRYSVEFRVASLNGGEFWLMVDGENIATVNIQKTNGYQNWKTIIASVNLDAGNQTIKIFSTSATIWNINWIRFTKEVVVVTDPPVVLPVVIFEVTIGDKKYSIFDNDTLGVEEIS